jgi:hypothetical protein
MKQTELQNLVQECIAEVLDEKYSEFQRVDKGSKGVTAKNKGEEETYGAGYAAGEKAAKAKYKKLAEAYKQLKEDGFGIGPRGLEVNDNSADTITESDEDEIFDKLRGNFASPVAGTALLMRVVELSRDYTYYDPKDIAHAAEKALHMIYSGNHTDSYDFSGNSEGY